MKKYTHLSNSLIPPWAFILSNLILHREKRNPKILNFCLHEAHKVSALSGKSVNFCTVCLGSLLLWRRDREKALSAVNWLKGAAESFHRPGALHQCGRVRRGWSVTTTVAAEWPRVLVRYAAVLLKRCRHKAIALRLEMPQTAFQLLSVQSDKMKRDERNQSEIHSLIGIIYSNRWRPRGRLSENKEPAGSDLRPAGVVTHREQAEPFSCPAHLALNLMYQPPEAFSGPPTRPSPDLALSVEELAEAGQARRRSFSLSQCTRKLCVETDFLCLIPEQEGMERKMVNDG